MASSSAEKYDVFISFRGSDTRKAFTSHLHAALIRRKIETYIDYRLEKGEELGVALPKAIEESKIYLVIFSEDYASSTWCLKELASIMECQGRGGRFVIPIFYGIDPANVRHQKESYQRAFANLEQRLGLTDEVLKWKQAVTKAANLSGFDSTSNTIRDDNNLVEQVVEDVLTKLKRNNTSNIPDNLVGVETRIQSIVEDLDIIPNDRRVRFVVIWGMGGIGKTTLADVVFHGLSSQFEACCFIANVRERSSAKGEFSSQLYGLRDELLRQLLGGRDLTIRTPTVDSHVKERLKRTKVLVVLDDVDHSSQLEVLAGDQVPFGPGSRVVITTRDLQPISEWQLLGKVANWDVKTYEVEELHAVESKQFFHSNSLINSSKNSNFLGRVLRYTAGVPLALKVLSPRFLQCKRQEDLEVLWEKLRKFPDKKLQNVYRASYDALEENEREIFLDIACFHKGKKPGDTKRILAACGLFPDDGIQILIDMSLISIKTIKSEYAWIGDSDYIWMHDVIQEMGVDIVREECSEEPGNRSRLHNWEDVSHVLKSNMGTANVRSIQSIHLKGYYVNSLTLCPQAFTRMHNLRFLKLRYLKFEDEAYLESLPNALTYLDWSDCPLKSLPSNFCPTNLVELHMPESKLTRFWYRGQNLMNLKSINLFHSPTLVEVGDLSNCVNIETINPSQCRSLVKVSDLSNCKKLKSINLTCCASLVEVGDLSNCVNIETIDLRHCTSLVKVSDLSNCKKLKSINLTCCASLVEVGDLSNCVNIETINLSECRSLVKVSDLSDCKKLKGIHLRECRSLVEVPDLSKSVSIESLSLEGCSSLVQIPPDIHQLTKLTHLNINLGGWSRRIYDYSGVWKIKSLTHLNLVFSEIESVPSSIESLTGIVSLGMSRCRRLVSLPTNICKLKSLLNLDLSYSENFTNFPEILEPMEHLEIILLSGTNIEELPSSFGNLVGLKKLDLSNCGSLREIPNCFDRLLALQELDLSGTMIQTIPPTIKHVSGLKSLMVSRCKRLRSLPVLPCLLEILIATECDSLKTVTASVTAHTQCLDQIISRSGYGYRKERHDFYPCPSLDEEARRNIMDDAYHRIMRFATTRNLERLSSAEFTVSCETTEIPKWFSCQTEGFSMNIKLPLHWFHSNLLGFALCVVTRTTERRALHTEFDMGYPMEYGYEMILKTKDGKAHSIFSDTVPFQCEGGMIVWYNNFEAVSDEAKESTEAYFEIYSDALKYEMILKTKDGEGHSIFSDTVPFLFQGDMIAWYNEFKAVSDKAKESAKAYFAIYPEEHAVERCGVCFLYPPGQDDNALKFEVIHPQEEVARFHIENEACGSQVPRDLEYNGTQTHGDDDTERQISGELEINETQSHYRLFQKLMSVLMCRRR